MCAFFLLVVVLGMVIIFSYTILLVVETGTVFFRFSPCKVAETTLFFLLLGT